MSNPNRCIRKKCSRKECRKPFILEESIDNMQQRVRHTCKANSKPMSFMYIDAEGQQCVDKRCDKKGCGRQFTLVKTIDNVRQKICPACKILNEHAPIGKSGQFDRSPPVTCEECDITLSAENRSHAKK
jgi:hypothetical protein